MPRKRSFRPVWKEDRDRRHAAFCSLLTILVKLVSQAGTGFSFNHKRSRLREKLTLLHYDPIVNKKVLFVEQKKIRSL
ncbi:39S ribosomal protein L33, mitochondrial [Sigmodon hispidus]